MGFFSYLFTGILLLGSIAVLVVTYLQWASRRARGNAPFPPLAKLFQKS